jgi:hypothetical protein
MTVPAGFSLTGGPITTSGTLALAFATGYILPQLDEIRAQTTTGTASAYVIAGYVGSRRNILIKPHVNNDALATLSPDGLNYQNIV